MDDFDDDFGFTIVDQTEFKAGEDGLTSQLQQLYDAILPLLKNLKANPEKDTIVWPNRVVKIDQFKNKIDTIVGDSIKRKKI